jgi:hypothetical protein
MIGQRDVYWRQLMERRWLMKGMHWVLDVLCKCVWGGVHYRERTCEEAELCTSIREGKDAFAS